MIFFDIVVGLLYRINCSLVFGCLEFFHVLIGKHFLLQVFFVGTFASISWWTQVSWPISILSFNLSVFNVSFDFLPNRFKILDLALQSEIFFPYTRCKADPFVQIPIVWNLQLYVRAAFWTSPYPYWLCFSLLKSFAWMWRHWHPHSEESHRAKDYKNSHPTIGSELNLSGLKLMCGYEFDSLTCNSCCGWIFVLVFLENAHLALTLHLDSWNF